jgi:hypothetical protein
MKTLFLLATLIAASSFCSAQSIVGRWQLIKQSSCVDDEVGALGDEESQLLVDEMKAMSGATPQVIEFRSNKTGQESTKIISSRKSYNSRSFLYRYDENGLYFLDKKSRTIIEGFTVERLEGDSLIISNTERVCETKVFVRIK